MSNKYLKKNETHRKKKIISIHKKNPELYWPNTSFLGRKQSPFWLQPKPVRTWERSSAWLGCVRIALYSPNSVLVVNRQEKLTQGLHKSSAWGPINNVTCSTSKDTRQLHAYWTIYYFILKNFCNIQPITVFLLPFCLTVVSYHCYI